MTLGERLQEILGDLPDGWTEARLVVTIPDVSQSDRAALLLGSLSPGRSGSTFLLTISASGAGAPAPDAARRVLEQLERDGIDARLSLPAGGVVVAAGEPRATARETFAGRWDALASTLPPDWSDLYLEVELTSSGDTDRAALLLGPANPYLHDDAPARFRFRAAHRFGYGAAPQMVRRVLARLDEDGIQGDLRVLRALSDTAPVATQGPVWREGGRAI